jgi:hypothetical protein
LLNHFLDRFRLDKEDLYRSILVSNQQISFVKVSHLKESDFHSLVDILFVLYSSVSILEMQVFAIKFAVSSGVHEISANCTHTSVVLVNFGKLSLTVGSLNVRISCDHFLVILATAFVLVISI